MKTIFFLVILIGYATFLMVVGLIPVAQPVSLPFVDKIEHFLSYFILGFLIVLNLKKYKTFHHKKIFLWALIIASAHGILLEVLQGFAPTRQADVWDALVDIAGATPGGWIFTYVKPFQKFFERLY